jgi:putative membrane protein
LLAGDRVLDGVFLSGLIPAIIAAAVLGLVNACIRPILLILTLPINFLTLGLFTFVINAMMLGLAAWVVPGFQVESLFSGIALAIVVAIIHGLATALLGDDRRD